MKLTIGLNMSVILVAISIGVLVFVFLDPLIFVLYVIFGVPVIYLFILLINYVEGEIREKKQKFYICPRCNILVEKRLGVCPECGHKI
ncbi:MAG: hypothetical protein ACFFD2_23870 [Promethearchaeota archaeon]